MEDNDLPKDAGVDDRIAWVLKQDKDQTKIAWACVIIAIVAVIFLVLK